jgi:transcriptional antiterminator NusG
MTKRWYAIHTQTGQEDRVKLSICRRISKLSDKSMIAQIIVPTERVSEVRAGQKKISTRKFFPGYILLEMELNDETWYLVRRTPGVTGFIGTGKTPQPLGKKEIESIIRKTEERKEKPIPKVTFKKGESVRVKEGPFVNFNGTVEEINLAKGKLKVSVSIFGRSTPLELEFWQVEKI